MKPLLLLSCVLLGGFSTVAAAEQGYTIAVIPKGTTHEFWKAINAGAFKARDELNAKGVKVNVIWKGPLKEDDRDQQGGELAQDEPLSWSFHLRRCASAVRVRCAGRTVSIRT